MSLSRIFLLLSLALTVAALVLAYLMGQPAPAGAAPLPNGHEREILALYFAQSVDDLAFLAGAEGGALREYMMKVQAYDMYFPFAFAGLAACLFAALGLRGVHLAWVGTLTALFVIGADLAENEVANRILADLEAGADPTERLDALNSHSWIKWWAIAGYMVWMSLVLFLEKRRILALFPVLGAVPIVIGWLTQPDGSVMAMTYPLLVVAMLSFPVIAIVYLRAGK